jgi:hypothetical protein
MNSQGLAMINLRLASIDKRGDPFQAVVNYLEGYFNPEAADRGLSTLNVDFNVHAGNVKALEDHGNIISGFVHQMCQ